MYNIPSNLPDFEPWEVRLRKRAKRRVRRPTLKQVLAQAQRAGRSVAGATVKPDGSVSLEFGQPATITDENFSANPWDAVKQ
jgi:hypothetical protein